MCDMCAEDFSARILRLEQPLYHQSSFNQTTVELSLSLLPRTVDGNNVLLTVCADSVHETHQTRGSRDRLPIAAMWPAAYQWLLRSVEADDRVVDSEWLS